MYRFKKSRIVFVGFVAVAAVMSAIAPISGQRRVQQIPISSFVDIQTPTQTITWTDPVSLNRLRFDLFGKRNEALGLNLGTSITGQVTIRDLGGGTERVNVIMYTGDGVCWGFAGLPPSPAFGRSPVEILAGAQASLGDELMRLDFTQPTGSPLPSFGEIFGGPPFVLEQLSATLRCQNGELRFASGLPDGTSGFAEATQIGLFATGVPSGCPPQNADCFPAERVQFKATSP